MTKKWFLIVLLFFSLVLSSCLPKQVQVAAPTVDPNVIAAVVVQTIQAQYAELTANAPTNTLSPTPTSTPASTFTNTPTPTETATPSSTAIPGVVVNITCNQAAFVADVTVPDGTQISAGNGFTKTWRLENTGSCTWTPAYLVVFDSGDPMGAPSSFNMPGFVNPGQTVDIAVDMTAPTDQGTYQSYWKFEDPNGNFFSVGPTAADFDVQIVVGNTPANFEVRHVYMSVDNISVTAQCPPGYTFTITADIWTNGNGNVVYRWEFSDGKRSDDRTISLDNNRHVTVSTTFHANETGAYWAVIHTTQPNDNIFDQVPFALTCTPALPTNTRTPTFTPLPTNTQEPTRTPRPTDTNEPARPSLPTNTKEPTRTPLPSETKQK